DGQRLLALRAPPVLLSRALRFAHELGSTFVEARPLVLQRGEVGRELTSDLGEALDAGALDLHQLVVVAIRATEDLRDEIAAGERRKRVRPPDACRHRAHRLTSGSSGARSPRQRWNASARSRSR